MKQKLNFIALTVLLFFMPLFTLHQSVFSQSLICKSSDGKYDTLPPVLMPCWEPATRTDFASYMPDTVNDPIRYIRLNFVFLEQPNEPDTIGGFHLNNPEHQQFWNDVVTLMNYRMAHFWLQPDSVSCNPFPGAHTIDTRIRFQVNMFSVQDSFYRNNENGYESPDSASLAACNGNDIAPGASNWYLYPLHHAINDTTANCTQAINVFFTENQTQYNNAVAGLDFDRCKISAAMFPGFPTAAPSQSDMAIHMVDQWLHYLEGVIWADTSATVFWDNNDYTNQNNARTWIVRTKANHILHEIGHCLSLVHTNIDAQWPFTETSCNIMCNTCSDVNFPAIAETQLQSLYKALSVSSVRSYIEGCPYNPNRPFIVSENQTWHDNVRLYQDLIIETGATLTLTCALHMPPNAKIIVQRGAKLILDGATISNSGCNCSQWQGIEVWGNTAKVHADLFTLLPPVLTAANYEAVSLQPDDPGMVILKNNAVIEQAVNAVATLNSNGFYTQYYGGVIYAENSAFSNNRKAIDLRPYKHANFSRFVNCSFTTNNHNTPFEGIAVEACKNIVIDSCRFIYAGAANPIHYQTGISAANTDKLQIINGSQFQNLTFGVYLQAANYNTGTAFIGNSNTAPNLFTNCRNGIVNLQTKFLQIENNRFTHTNPYAQHITMSGTCGYEIHNNSFNNAHALAAFFTSLDRTGDNNFYCNTLDSCTYGLYANNNNSGLQFYNNNFTTTQADVQIDGNNSSIGFIQGIFDPIYGFLPFFNLFTHLRPTYRIVTNGETMPFTYYYHIDYANFSIAVNARLTPNCFIGDIYTGCNSEYYNFFGQDVPWPSNTPYDTTCLTLLSDGGSGGFMQPDSTECNTRACYDSLRLYISALKDSIDGGSTQMLLNAIQTNPGSPATAQLLLYLSPYLSDTVLAAAAQNAVMPAAARGNILIANAPLSDAMMNIAYTAVSAATYQILYSIKYYYSISERDRLNMRIAAYTDESESLFRELIEKYANENDYAALENLLAAQNNKFALRALLSAKMEQQQWQTAANILNNLPANTPEEQDFITIQQINLQRLSAAQNFELDAEQANQLYAIANAYGYQAPAAQTLLGLLNGNYYEWPIPQSSGKATQTLRYPAAQVTGNLSVSAFAIYPNPAAQTAQVTIPPLFAQQPVELCLFNMHGKLMLRQTIPAFANTATVNIQTLPNGIYFAVLNAQGMPTAQVKLMIQH